MFSGLTNQVSSWMGAAKEEQVPTPTETEPSAQPDAETQGGAGKLEMLANVKSQMSGWLGSGVSVIPGLRRAAGDGGDEQPAGIDNPAHQDLASDSPLPESPAKVAKDDDDNSSDRYGREPGRHVTEGADSGPASGAGTPTDEKDPQFDAGKVSTKALAGAKSIGSFLYSAVNKAGKTVSEASAKIKKTVEENSILGEFNKEQEAFIKEQQAKTATSSVPPWVGCPNEESLKEECLSLSTDRRNFVRSPPAGVDFQFDYEVSYPVAVAIMAEDPNLEKMRFDLVPKVINEETFWRNYFYRVSLICQANEQSFGGDATARDATNANEDWAQEIANELKEFEVLDDETETGVEDDEATRLDNAKIADLIENLLNEEEEKEDLK